MQKFPLEFLAVRAEQVVKDSTPWELFDCEAAYFEAAGIVDGKHVRLRLIVGRTDHLGVDLDNQ